MKKPKLEEGIPSKPSPVLTSKIKPDSLLGRRGGMVPTVSLGPNTAETGESMSEHTDKEDIRLHAENQRLKDLLRSALPAAICCHEDFRHLPPVPGTPERFLYPISDAKDEFVLNNRLIVEEIKQVLGL